MNVTAVQYVSAMEEGWSKAQLFLCDDGNKYVVKMMNNPQGIKVLPNELIAYRLGRMLHLPVGKCTVVYITEELINLYPPLRNMQVQPGPHLGTLYYKNAKVLQKARDLRGCHNLGKAAGMIAFDHWKQNWDRGWDNARNVLVLQEESKFVMIDHANAFTGGNWTLDSLKQNRKNATVYWGLIYELFSYRISRVTVPSRKYLKK